MTTLSTIQYATIACIGTISAFLSLLGSIAIILKGKNKARNDPYHRFVLCLSFYDFVVSTIVILQPWVIPSDSGLPYPFGIGNDVSCTVARSLTVGGSFMVTFYNCYLSLLLFIDCQI